MIKLLAADGLSKAYRCGKPILDAVSLSVGSGEIVSITGRSGEGKSTIARILCGAVRPDSGRAWLEGDLLIGENGRYNHALCPRIQLIQQQPFAALDPRQKILDAVAEPILAHRLTKTKAEAYSRAEELLRSVWLPSDIYHRLPSQISGGQAQRAVIARAMGVKPRLIVADEATSMLDILSQAQVMGIFRELSKQQGIAILLISHDLQLVKAVATRGYHLSDQKLTETKGDYIE
ncbi:MAG: dipeptide/oligopeptide/nickel ABC transporter ATP-binding protein [Angelakisella sp.]